MRGHTVALRIAGGAVIKERIIGGEIKEVKGIERAITKVSYFRGDDPGKWQAGLSTYNGVSLGEVYKGIRAELKARGSNVEKLFYVQPEGDPSKMRIEVEGAEGIRLNEAGELVLETPHGEVKFTKPVAYQKINGKRVDVKAAYRVEEVKDENGKGRLVYAFHVGEYDKSRELIIAPLLASTFLGGSSSDYGNSIALDSSGNVYVTGYTNSSNFPTTSGAYDKVTIIMMSLSQSLITL